MRIDNRFPYLLPEVWVVANWFFLCVCVND